MVNRVPILSYKYSSVQSSKKGHCWLLRLGPRLVTVIRPGDGQGMDTLLIGPSFYVREVPNLSTLLGLIKNLYNSLPTLPLVFVYFD